MLKIKILILLILFFSLTVFSQNKLLEVDAGETQEICFSDECFLNGNVSPNYDNVLWEKIEGSGNIVNTTNISTQIINLTHGLSKFKLTAFLNSEQAEDEVSIFIYSTKAYAGEDDISYTPFTLLSGNTPNYATGIWSNTDVGSGNIETPTNFETEVYEITEGDNKFVWTLTYSSTCISVDTINIFYNGFHAEAGNYAQTCYDTISLNAEIPELGTGTWSSENPDIIIHDINNPKSKVNNLPAGKTIFTWTVIDGTFTHDDTVSIYRIFFDVLGEDISLCNSTVEMNANPQTGNGYLGTWTSLSENTFIQNNTLHNTLITNLKQGVNEFIWSVTKDKCTISDTVFITNNLPDKPNAGEDQTVDNAKAQMNANEPIIGSGNWFFAEGDGNILQENNPKTEVKNLTDIYNKLVWKLTNKDCILKDTVLIINTKNTCSLSGSMVLSNDYPIEKGKIIIFRKNENANDKAMRLLNVENGNYNLELLPFGDYYIYGIPISDKLHIPSYYYVENRWQNANILSLNGNAEKVKIKLEYLNENITGDATIKGKIVSMNQNFYEKEIFDFDWFNDKYFSKNKNETARNIPIFLLSENNRVLRWGLSDENGKFEFNNISYGNFKLHCEKGGYVFMGNEIINLSPEESLKNIELFIEDGYIRMITNVSINDFSSKFKIYPNPATTEIIIELDKNKISENSLYNIYNASGKMVKEGKFFKKDKNQININNLKSGFYFMKIVGENVFMISFCVKK